MREEPAQLMSCGRTRSTHPARWPGQIPQGVTGVGGGGRSPWSKDAACLLGGALGCCSHLCQVWFGSMGLGQGGVRQREQGGHSFTPQGDACPKLSR